MSFLCLQIFLTNYKKDRDSGFLSVHSQLQYFSKMKTYFRKKFPSVAQFDPNKKLEHDVSFLFWKRRYLGFILTMRFCPVAVVVGRDAVRSEA